MGVVNLHKNKGQCTKQTKHKPVSLLCW